MLLVPHKGRDHMKNEEVLNKVKEDRDIKYKIK